MTDTCRAYLALLNALRDGLENLSTLARQTMDAVEHDDLIALDQVMRQQQAMALSFRGLEQKRVTLLRQLGWERLPLSSLPERFPAELQAEARQAVESLQNSYRLYSELSQKAQSILLDNVHEIEHFIIEMGGQLPDGNVPGYAPQPPQPPKSMRTDFHA